MRRTDDQIPEQISPVVVFRRLTRIHGQYFLSQSLLVCNDSQTTNEKNKRQQLTTIDC